MTEPIVLNIDIDKGLPSGVVVCVPESWDEEQILRFVRTMFSSIGAGETWRIVEEPQEECLDESRKLVKHVRVEV